MAQSRLSNWRLKLSLPERWLRVHTLPGSKRYAESDAEAVEIARRQAVAAQVVFEEAAPVWVVTWVYGSPAETTDDLVATTGLRFQKVCVLDEGEQDEAVAVLVACECWSMVTSAIVRRAIAEDRVRAMWVNQSTGEIFSPYDGGVDLILSTVQRRDATRERLSAWLSLRPDRL